MGLLRLGLLLEADPVSGEEALRTGGILTRLLNLAADAIFGTAKSYC
jgi:hypothetical protein